MKRRLHVPPERIAAGRAVLGPEARHYLRDVLRLPPGAEVEVFDGAGSLWDGHLDAAHEAIALGRRREARGSPAAIWLAFALAKGEKVDLVVQKATELGAARLLPFAAARSVVRLDPARGEERAARWRRIASEAARQCGRADVPDVLAPSALAEALEAPPGFARLVFHREGGLPLGAVPPSPAAGYLAVVGPEGGLAPEELRACEAAGAIRAALGPRTLRAETAALAAVALLQARFGDLGLAGG
ncbi:MAG TPA: 16S rRNA (uracil(1498)-N(3))-methyltransferase [Anaeromyxobacteraceae bacterium]|nr:16S rRNA (uracil(1498)-N(3))-methyltransferase [Anaeromyxobacteraceae bacterium]